MYSIFTLLRPSSKGILVILWISTSLVSHESPAQGEDFKKSGHLKYYGSYFDFDSNDDITHSFDVRGNVSDTDENLEFIAEGQAFLDSRSRAHPISLVNDSKRIFDFAAIFDETGRAQSVARMDRFSLAFKGSESLVRVGRQALSLGNGLVFQAIDPFNPFSPTVVDKEYKTGDDMLYARSSVAEEVDVQFAAVGRRGEPYGRIEYDASSFVSRLHAGGLPFEMSADLLAAIHRDEPWYGLGLSREVEGGILRSDIGIVDESDGGHAVNVIANYDRGFELCGKNAYWFIEFFKNGFGIADGNLETPHPSLGKRLADGELFTTRSYYVAVGGRIEIYPRTNSYLSVFRNLQDSSAVIMGRVVQELSQNLNATLGATIPLGDQGSEFGGATLPGGTVAHLPIDVFARIEWYF